jgi:hypothetical protein
VHHPSGLVLKEIWKLEKIIIFVGVTPLKLATYYAKSLRNRPDDSDPL